MPRQQDSCPMTRSAESAPVRSSAVSQALRALSEDGSSAGMDSPTRPRLRVANDVGSRARAYRLAYDLYRTKGYVEEVEQGWLVSPWDLEPETLTLLAEGSEDEALATVSLVFDDSGRLPCDAVFGDLLSDLRVQKRRIVEVTRLAIGEAYLCSRQLLVQLFNWIYIYARRVRRGDDFVVEVNPKHENYYRRMLGFEILGEARSCPRVRGAPAMLLRLDLALPEREILRVGGLGAAAGERSLYPYFLTGEAERAVERKLRWQYRPLSADEARYFGITGALHNS